jgi:hypothetical protein
MLNMPGAFKEIKNHATQVADLTTDQLGFVAKASKAMESKNIQIPGYKPSFNKIKRPSAKSKRPRKGLVKSSPRYLFI